jgi:hypothetical protein
MIADLERQITDLRLSQTAMDPLALTVSPNVQSNSRNATLNPGSWTLKISNGEFQIETGIRNISDLFLMQPIQYLSPINHLSDDQGSQGLVLYFDSEKLISLVPLTMRVLEDFMKQKPIQESLTVPTSILFDSHSIVDRLLETYFNCHNVYKPLIHKATFMKEYRQLNSPLDSLVCLCICSYVCAIPCEHTTNDFNELRYMGDYFYTLAKSKLIDQFDEPDKRLENVVCISLLTDYMHITLRLADCRRFASIAYQICYDLKNHYERSTNDHSSLVDQALFRRHFNEIMEMSQMMNFIGNESLDIFTYERLYWTHLPDELAQTIDFIEGQNWLFKLYNHPFINNIRVIFIHNMTHFFYLLSLLDTNISNTLGRCLLS